MKILIVGGGVAGPAFARFMKDDAEITLVDKAPAWGNIGYAITLWGNGQKILKELGVDHIVLKQGYQIPWNAYEDKKGKLLAATLSDVFHPYGPTMVVTRTDLQQTLVRDLEKSVRIKMGTTISSLIQNRDNITVAFSDGTSDNFDLVVGADGVRSQVREMVFGKDFLKYYGWTVYGFWAPHSMATPRGAIEFSTGGRICMIYPLEDKAVVLLFISSQYAKSPVDMKESPQKILHELFSDFKLSVEEYIDNIEDPAHIFHDNIAYISMHMWYKGRVVLMGDAKHAISPLLGMGSSMALEDAYVLAEELKNNKNDIDLALKRYEERRDGRIKRFHKVSDSIERFMMVKSPFWAFFRDIALELIPMSTFTRKIEKVLTEKI